MSEVQALTALAAVIALRVRGEIPAGIELATRLVRLSDPSAGPEQPVFARLRGLVLTQAAFLHQLDGRATQAHSLWESAQHALVVLSPGVTTGMAAGALAQLAAERGDLPETEARLTEHRASPPSTDWLARRAAAPALIAQTWLALEQLRVDDAGGLLTDLVRRRHQDESWTAITQVQAASELLWGDSAAMLETLDVVRTQRAELMTPGSYADVVLLAAAVDQHLCLGQATAAATLLERAPGHALIVVRRARLALVTGPPEGVLVHSLHGVESTTRERLELLLLHAAAHRRAGDEDLARELSLRCERLLVRTRLTTPLSGLPRHDLEGLARLAPEGGRLRELTGAGVPAPYPAWAEIVVLTEREGLVLDGLVEGLGVEALARRLFVSPNTVKTQVRSLYRKLGARSRGEALTRARILGLRA